MIYSECFYRLCSPFNIFKLWSLIAPSPKIHTHSFFQIHFCPRSFFIHTQYFKCLQDRFFCFIYQLSIVSSANMLSFDSIFSPCLLGSEMPIMLGLLLTDAANGSACKIYNIGAIGHP